MDWIKCTAHNTCLFQEKPPYLCHRDYIVMSLFRKDNLGIFLIWFIQNDFLTDDLYDL